MSACQSHAPSPAPPCNNLVSSASCGDKGKGKANNNDVDLHQLEKHREKVQARLEELRASVAYWEQQERIALAEYVAAGGDVNELLEMASIDPLEASYENVAETSTVAGSSRSAGTEVGVELSQDDVAWTDRICPDTSHDEILQRLHQRMRMSRAGWKAETMSCQHGLSCASASRVPHGYQIGDEHQEQASFVNDDDADFQLAMKLQREELLEQYREQFARREMALLPTIPGCNPNLVKDVPMKMDENDAQLIAGKVGRDCASGTVMENGGADKHSEVGKGKEKAIR